MIHSPSKPFSPYVVLAAATLLPGSGHVLNRMPQRGLVFLFFIIVLGWATSKVAPAQASFIGQYAGGVLIYGFSVLDAYKQARINWEVWRFQQRQTPDG
jgi:hypothetical protein